MQVPRKGERRIQTTPIEVAELARWLDSYAELQDLGRNSPTAILGEICWPAENLAKRNVMEANRLAASFKKKAMSRGRAGKPLTKFDLVLSEQDINWLILRIGPRRGIFGGRKRDPIPESMFWAKYLATKICRTKFERRGRPPIFDASENRTANLSDRQFYRIHEQQRLRSDRQLGDLLAKYLDKPKGSRKST